MLFITQYVRHLNGMVPFLINWGLLWSWSYGSWIYNYPCNQCLLPLTLWVWIPLRLDILDTTYNNKVCQWLVAGQWFSSGTPVSCNKTDHHDITEILLKLALNTIILTPNPLINWPHLWHNGKHARLECGRLCVRAPVGLNQRL